MTHSVYVGNIYHYYSIKKVNLVTYGMFNGLVLDIVTLYKYIF